MDKQDWRRFGEIQYLKGRLDELFKIDKLAQLDMADMRIIDARIEKYFNKLESLDPVAFELYRIERENIQHSIKRAQKNAGDA